MRQVLPALLLFLLAVTVCGAADFLAEGRQLEAQGNNPAALDIYLKGIAESPGEELYLAAGRLLGKIKQYDRGNKMVDEALTRFPESEQLLKMSVLFKSRLGRDDEAKALARKLKKDAVPTANSSSPAKTPVTAVNIADLSPLPVEQQATAAAEIIIELQKVDHAEIAVYEAGLKKLIYTCPTSVYAPEACWKLANLYLFSSNFPDYQNAVFYLEKIIADFPASGLVEGCFTRLKNLAEKTGNDELLLKTAAAAQGFKLWSEENLNFWKCHEACAMIRLARRDEGMQKLQQVLQNRDTTPRSAEYAEFLMGNL
jgi:tetratricopeptide (TPR) repeat protein